MLGDPASREVCSKREVVQRWGREVEFYKGEGGACRGYEFREEDGKGYHLYVSELFERVHQRSLCRRILPLHFARGLAMEARGEQVNWLAFSMSRFFSGHKQTPFNPLEKYTSLSAPLPWVYVKVLPALKFDIAGPSNALAPVRT